MGNFISRKSRSVPPVETQRVETPHSPDVTRPDMEVSGMLAVMDMAEERKKLNIGVSTRSLSKTAKMSKSQKKSSTKKKR